MILPIFINTCIAEHNTQFPVLCCPGTLHNTAKGAHLRVSSSHEFSVAHFTGTVTYDARDMADQNHDFLPPEMIETLRLSTNTTIKKLFTNQMSRCGILTFSVEPHPPVITPSVETKKGRWGALLVADTQSRARVILFYHRGFPASNDACRKEMGSLGLLRGAVPALALSIEGNTNT